MSFYNRLWFLLAWGSLESIPLGLLYKRRVFKVTVGSNASNQLWTRALFQSLTFSQWHTACQCRSGWPAWPCVAWNTAHVWELCLRRPWEYTSWLQEKATRLPTSLVFFHIEMLQMAETFHGLTESLITDFSLWMWDMQSVFLFNWCARCSLVYV